MTKVTLAAPDSRKTVIISDETTVKEILDSNSINYSRASVILDGTILTPDNLRKSLTDLGATGDCTIAICVKMDNAA